MAVASGSLPPSTGRLLVKRAGHAITRQVPKSVIVVDTREQMPYLFQGYGHWIGGVVRATLPTGDYSVQGWEALVAMERKSLADLVLSLTASRARFLRECERLAEIPHRAILVEATWEEIKTPYVDSEIPSSAHPNAIAGSLAAIQARWNIPILCLSRDRGLSEEWAASWLTKVATYAWLEAQGLGRVLQEGDL